MAIDRHDNRELLEESEANAIGTEYLRADLLPPQASARTKDLLQQYLAQRILFYSKQDKDKIQEIRRKTDELQDSLWKEILPIARTHATPINALVLSGMNDVINSQGYVQAAWWNRIPYAAWSLMAVIAICANLLVGFGARKLASDEEDQGPKYLNTSETPIYKKSQVLYGLDVAKKEIAKKRQAVIVEGYTDVMAAHLAGITTAVATCGTAFGADHIRILRRLLMDDDAFRGEVIFTFDGDAAGQKAALRAFSEDQKFVTQTFVAVEPDGLDPCELRQEKGDLALRDLIARRVPLFEFAIRAELAHHKLDTAEGRVNALNAAAPLVAQIRDKSLRPEYTRLLAGWLGVEVEIVTRAVAQGAKAAPQQSRQQVEEVPAQPNFRPDPNEARLILEREVLKSRLQEPQLFDGDLWSSIEPGAFTHPAYSAMRTAIDTHEKISPEVITDENLRALFTELTVEPIRADGKPTQLYVASIVARLREVAISRSIADLKSSLQRLNPVENEIEYNAAFAQLVALESARRSLHDLALGSL